MEDKLAWLFGFEKLLSYHDFIDEKKFIRNIINLKYTDEKNRPWALKNLISDDFKSYPESGRDDRINFYTNVCVSDELSTSELLGVCQIIWPNNELFNKVNAISGDLQLLNVVFAKSQILSKIWMAEALGKHFTTFGNILLVGGWLTHHTIFFKNINFTNLYSVDTDPEINDLAKVFNPTVKILNGDINKSIKGNGILIIDNESTIPDLVINTSAEHMTDDWFYNIKSGTKILIQSNNDRLIDHINYCENFGIFLKRYPLTNVLYRGELSLPKYKRFCIYGEK